MSGIKYYRLAENEEAPDEFCAIRDRDGEPSEYIFYVPDPDNEKLHKANEELLIDVDLMNCRLRARADENANLQELVKDMWECIKDYANELDVEVHGYIWPYVKNGYSNKVRNGEGDFVGFPDRMRELGIEVDE